MPAADHYPIRRALLSVADKTGIVELAQALQQMGVVIISTGGTCRLLCDHGVEAIDVSAVTGFPAIMDGRVKTLHPLIHGGILGRRGQDNTVMQAHGIEPIDLVVVNLYPFEQTIAAPGCCLAEAVEQIDIGGPTMLRAAAKNHAFVTTVVDTVDYVALIEAMRVNQHAVSPALRLQLATKVYQHTAQYDAAIAHYLAGQSVDDESTHDHDCFPEALCFPEVLIDAWYKHQTMRYGENPHQSAAFYREKRPEPGCVATAEQRQGKALSYNNIADSDTALECVKSFHEPACVIVKHANPCGVAIAGDVWQAYRWAYATDPESAFGGVIAFNRELDEVTAQAIVDQQFVEVIIVPAATRAAQAMIATKPNVRLLVCGAWDTPQSTFDYKRVTGGLLVQSRDLGSVAAGDLQIVSQRVPADGDMRDLLFAWQVAKWVKSNAIVYAKDGRTVGIGAGQMSRVNSARIAADKAQQAGLETGACVMASDAFFPFRDGIDRAASLGIAAVIQPGGSMRDAEVIAAADEAGMAMVFTGMRHFRH